MRRGTASQMLVLGLGIAVGIGSANTPWATPSS